MRLSPFPSRRVDFVPIGYLLPSGVVHDCSNAIPRALPASNSHVIYCSSAATCLRLAREYGGVAYLLRSRHSSKWLRFEIAGRTIFPGVDAAMPELVAFRDWAKTIGIQPAALAQMAFYMLRYTLPGYCDIATGQGIPFNQFPPGARMHAKPGVYSATTQLDIRAAYLWGIGTLDAARGYVKLNRCHPETLIENPCSFALVRYRHAGGMEHGPLPAFSDNGTTVYPTVREWSDEILLSGSDIAVALQMGIELRQRKVWLATQPVSAFTGFLHLISELRENSKFPTVAKLVGNTLWGLFGANDRIDRVTFKAGATRNKIEHMPPRPAKCPSISYAVMSRLRAKVYLDAVGNNLLQCHTDGVIYETDRAPLHILGDGQPGDWRLVRHHRETEILEPAWYRYIDEHGREHFRTAGREGNAEVFNRMRERFIADAEPAPETEDGLFG